MNPTTLGRTTVAIRPVAETSKPWPIQTTVAWAAAIEGVAELAARETEEVWVLAIVEARVEGLE
jgi:hypothetical protein